MYIPPPSILTGQPQMIGEWFRVPLVKGISSRHEKLSVYWLIARCPCRIIISFWYNRATSKFWFYYWSCTYLTYYCTMIDGFKLHVCVANAVNTFGCYSSAWFYTAELLSWRRRPSSQVSRKTLYGSRRNFMGSYLSAISLGLFSQIFYFQS